MVDKKMKLSFCTTCMNRVEYLKETLPQNIKLISKYNYELTLVNYDSKDDLHDYIINNYKEYIDNKGNSIFPKASFLIVIILFSIFVSISFSLTL